MRRLANPVTLCDGHGVFFVAASGQIQMAADMPGASEVSGWGAVTPWTVEETVPGGLIDTPAL